MNSIRQTCPTCKNLGWIEVVKDDLRPCPSCGHVEGPTKRDLAFIGACAVALILLVLWGAR